MLVVDASVVVPACLAADGFAEFGTEQLIAPALLWSESLSVLHELVWRREVSAEDGNLARETLRHAPIERVDVELVGEEAWRIADELGWAKTYDAEYVALARLRECRLVTLDGRLHRSGKRLGLIVSPGELR